MKALTQTLLLSSAVTRARFLKGIWRIADPKITLASVASMILGGSIAALHGPISWGWLAATVFGIFFLEAAKNASGEIFDFDSGTDLAIRPDEQSPFSGGKRVLVDALMTRHQLALVAALFYAAGIGIGIAIVFACEPRVVWIGVAGVSLAYFYHAPPLALSYRGLGELAVGVTYGPLIACGTYLVQRHAIAGEVIFASVPLGLAIAAFLVINEMPDARADELAGKKTLVVRLGRARAALLFTAIFTAVFSLITLLPYAGLPWSVWLGFLGLPAASLAAMRVARFQGNVAELVPAQQWTLLSFLLTAVGMSVGMLALR